jgi:diguanylate cyclase (GGDEF)-like protein/PAS domain S-box-containing protein
MVYFVERRGVMKNVELTKIKFRLIILILIILKSTTLTTGQDIKPDLIINEFLASNGETIFDESGESSDWIEIFNNSNSYIDLGGMYISDKLDNPLKYQIPHKQPAETTIPPKGFLLLWADDKPEKGPLHLNFSLAKSGEAIIITASDETTIIDKVLFSKQSRDISFGRSNIDSNEWSFFIDPTPKKANNTFGIFSIRIATLYDFYKENLLLLNVIIGLVILLIISLLLFILKLSDRNRELKKAKLKYNELFNNILKGFSSDFNKDKAIDKVLKEKAFEQNILLENIKIHVWYLVDEKTYGAVNKAHAEFLGRRKDEINNANLYSIFDQETAERCIEYNEKVFTEKQELTKEEWIKNGKGEYRLLLITKTPKLDKNGKVEYVVCSAYDITERKEIEQEIKYMNSHDELTGVYNRAYYEQMLVQLDSQNYLPLSIVVGDVNGLKLTNDVFGHKEGDRLLKEIAVVLENSTRKDDIVTRLGGDEFCILLPQTDAKTVDKVIERIKENCTAAALDPIPLNIAVGSATKVRPEDEIEEVFKEAEDKMYIDKGRNKDNFQNPLLTSMVDRLFNEDYESIYHVSRVRELAVKLGAKLNLDKHSLYKLALLSEFHDIGKLTVPLEILNKEEEDLSAREIELIQNHTEAGYNIAKNFKCLNSISELILYHHENWDGSGYPNGISKEEIPLNSKIINAINFYDRLINSDSFTKEDAIIELKKKAGIKLDPEVVEVLIDLLN